MYPNLLATSVYEEITAGINADALASIKTQANRAWISPGSNHEVVLQLPAGAVVDRIDSSIYVAITDLPISGHVGAPISWITSQNVVHLTRQLVSAGYFGVRICPK